VKGGVNDGVNNGVNDGSHRRRGSEERLVDAAGERLSALLDRGTSTARLALAETRLAASSAALLVGLAVAAIALAFVIWIQLLVLAGYGLWGLGLTPAGSMLVLLGVHLAIAAVIGLLARRLAADLRFAHTRRALSSAAPEDRAVTTGAVGEPAATTPHTSARGRPDDGQAS